MARLISLLTAVLVVGGLASAPLVAQETVFPTVKARTLNKDRITVPADFTAERNVLLISFGRDMQEPVDAWDAALTQLRESSDAIQVYNTPLIPKPNGIIRGFINGGFRGIYEDDAMRDRVVILYVKEKEVFPALNIGEDDKAVPLILVTNKAGKILGRVSGLPEGSNVDAVIALVQGTES